jgi:hypothetical protein
MLALEIWIAMFNQVTRLRRQVQAKMNPIFDSCPSEAKAFTHQLSGCARD